MFYLSGNIVSRNLFFFAKVLLSASQLHKLCIKHLIAIRTIYMQVCSLISSLLRLQVYRSKSISI